MLKGWANYHRHAASSRTFSKVGAAVFRMLWRWALRRHRRRSKRWIKAKYFGHVGDRNWVFQGKDADASGVTRLMRLFYIECVPIKRHTKVRGEANPYDPEWEPYFERRIDARMKDDLKGRWQLFSLWPEQKGLCPMCGQKITRATGWRSHHIVWRCHGGADGVSNRVLLHPNCHSQVHSRKLNVVKPRPRKGASREA